MEGGAGRAPARQDEVRERWQLGLEPIDGGLETRVPSKSAVSPRSPVRV